MSVPVLLAYNTNGKKRSLAWSKSSSEAEVLFAHYLDINLQQSSTVVGRNCEKRSATDGLTHRLLTSVNLELPSKSWSISR
jgi:hypothetical protein